MCKKYVKCDMVGITAGKVKVKSQATAPWLAQQKKKKKKENKPQGFKKDTKSHRWYLAIQNYYDDYKSLKTHPKSCTLSQVGEASLESRSFTPNFRLPKPWELRAPSDTEKLVIGCSRCFLSCHGSPSCSALWPVEIRSLISDSSIFSSLPTAA